MYETLIPIAFGSTTAITGILWLNAKTQLLTMTQARNGLASENLGLRFDLEACARQCDNRRDEIVTKRAEIKTLTSKLTKAEARAVAAEIERDALISVGNAIAKVKAPKAPAAKVRSDAAPKPAAKRAFRAKAGAK